MRIGIRHKLPPSSAGASFSSLPNKPNRGHCRPPPLLNTRGELCQIWLSPYAKPVGRHHFVLAKRCAQNSSKFCDILTFSILNPMARYPSTTAHSFDILIPVVAHHGPSDVLELLFTSILCGCCYQHHYRQFLTPGEEILALRSPVACPQATTANATNVIFPLTYGTYVHTLIFPFAPFVSLVLLSFSASFVC